MSAWDVVDLLPWAFVLAALSWGESPGPAFRWVRDTAEYWAGRAAVASYLRRRR